MVIQIAFSQHLLISHPPLSFPVISSPRFKSFPERRRKAASFDTFLANGSFSFRFSVGRRRGVSGSWRCWCKGWEESDGEDGLEAEILVFMNKSEKPEAFPTKEELMNGGRMDLVEAILKKGGWLSMGWDSDDENDEKDGFSSFYSESADFNIADFQDRVASLQESNSSKDREVESTHSSQLASPSGRSLDMAAEDIAGIEGILNRLEKERNLTLGINLGSNGYKTNASRENDGDPTHFRNLADASE